MQATKAEIEKLKNPKILKSAQKYSEPIVITRKGLLHHILKLIVEGRDMIYNYDSL